MKLTLKPAVGEVASVPVGGDPAKLDAGRLRVLGGIGILKEDRLAQGIEGCAQLHSRCGQARSRYGLPSEITGRS